MGTPVCVYCKLHIRGPRLVFKENWCCTDCMYYLERGEDPRKVIKD